MILDFGLFRKDRSMRAVLQRVTSASVRISNHTVGSIEQGWLVLLGITSEDQASQVAPFVEKIIGLRLFSDDAGKFNLSVKDVSGSILVVSQFTLFADCSRGRRPSFTKAARPDYARCLYDLFVEECRKRAVKTETGEFGADMQVSLVNDGPVTIVLDDQIWKGGTLTDDS